VTQEFADALWTAQLAAQDELAAKFSGATHITKTNSGHYIHVEQPQLVVDAITQVVDAARGTPRPT
jgi:pimeloyl-ACP methyl ester carboxylesterase